MAKQTNRRTGITVAVLPTGTKVSAKRRRKLAPELRIDQGRKPPLRADRTPVDTLRVWKGNQNGR